MFPIPLGSAPMDGPSSFETRLPTLAVLPFTCAGTSDEDALLAQGLHGDICTELTRFRGLRVISPASAAVVADLGDDAIGSRLRASHVLRGHLRRLGAQLQLDTALSCTREATQLWSERLHVPEGEIHALEVEVVGRIAATLNARLQEEQLAVARKATATLAPHLATLRGFRLLREGSLEADEAARALFEEALALDPGFARAHAGIAFSWFNEWSCQYWDRFEENGRLAYAHAHRALSFDDRDGQLHQVLGKVLLYHRDHARAAWYFDRALALCPNDPEILIAQALYDAYLGRPEAGIEHAARAMRLNPYHPPYYFGLAAIPHLVAGEFEKAVSLGLQADGIPNVDVPAFWAVALAHHGAFDRAREQFDLYKANLCAKILNGRTPDPGEAVRWFVDYNPFRRPEHVAIFVDGFRLIDAALPRAAPAATMDAVLARTGTGWLVDYAGRSAVLGELKGLHDIRHLVERPGTEVHCLDLAGRDGEDAGGNVLDERARNAIKQRIRDLQEVLAEAEDMNDIGKAEAARNELDRLVEHLSAALGLGGRARRLGDLAEKARTSVTWRIRHALRRIEAAHPALGRHFANSIRTGTFCRYSPEHPMAWRFEVPASRAVAAAQDVVAP